MDGDLTRELHHVLAEEGHPRRAVRLLQVAARGKRGAAVEDADVVQAEEAPFEDVLAEPVLPVHPPGEVQQQLVERRLEEIDVHVAAQGLLGAVQEERREGVDRGVHVAEVPLVGGHLPAGVQVDTAQHQFHLLLGEVGVHDRERERVEGQVPGRVPGVLPLVGHRDDVLVHHMEPLRVPRGTIPGMEGVGVVFVQPVVAVEEVELLAPQHAGDGLAHHVGRVRGDGRRGHRAVERVRLLQPDGYGLVKLRAEAGCGIGFPTLAGSGLAGQAQPHGRRLSGGDVQPIVRRDLGALLSGIHRALVALHHAVVDAVLDVRGVVLMSGEEPLVVRLVFGEEQRHLAFAAEGVLPQRRIRCRGRACARRRVDLPEVRFMGSPADVGDPRRPVVAEPERRQEVQFRRVRSPVGCGDLHQDVFRAGFGVLHENVEIAIGVEDAGVEEFILHLVPGATAVRLRQVGVGKGRLRVLVEVLHVRMGRRAVEVEVVFLDVLAVVPFAVGQAEEPFLENRVLPVPQGQREAQVHLLIGNAGQPVFAPAISAGAGMIVCEEIPGVAPLAVVLADRPPLSLTEVGTPFLPCGLPLAGFLESVMFVGQGHISTPLS